MTCCKTVYNAFIFSKLNYRSEIYINTTSTKKYMQPLMVTQNKLLRILQFKHIRTPLRNLYRQFNTLKLKDLHYFNICCIVQKSIHLPNLLPEAINDIFCRNDQIHDHDTRNKNDLHPVKIKTKMYGEKTISFQGTTFYPSISRKRLQSTSSKRE